VRKDDTCEGVIPTVNQQFFMDPRSEMGAGKDPANPKGLAALLGKVED